MNHVKESLLRRVHAVSIFLVPDRCPEALVSTLTIFYYLSHIGVIARRFSTKLPGSIFQYVLRVHTNFHAQTSARRATDTTKSFPTKALHPVRRFSPTESPLLIRKRSFRESVSIIPTNLLEACVSQRTTCRCERNKCVSRRTEDTCASKYHV